MVELMREGLRSSSGRGRLPPVNSVEMQRDRVV